ncbi:30S ribosomal protein S21 [Kordia sp. TARA_039_SRF]|jgi:small subunit ribosomal protein S21|nr:30S ribosomal protein S21 [Kordia sp. TARA_039_SRF]
MLKIIVKEGESIERALKRYKRKHRNVKRAQEVRERKHFKKKSVRRREEVQKAAYIQKLRTEEENK